MKPYNIVMCPKILLYMHIFVSCAPQYILAITLSNQLHAIIAEDQQSVATLL